MKSTILVKNATLWQWDEGKCGEIRAGHVVHKSWFAIDKGIITDSSSNSMGSQEKQPPPEVTFGSIIDVKHQLVIPGLNDAHIHVAMTGESNYFLNLKGCASIEDLIKNLSEHSAKFPKSILPWISGINWDQVEVSSLTILICLKYGFSTNALFRLECCISHSNRWSRNFISSHTEEILE
jgi:predicted amidohydrolase YtcJ